MLIAVFFMGATLSLLIRVNLGTDPCSCMNLGISRVSGVSFGTCQLCFNLLLALVVVLVNRRLIGLGTLGNMVLVGYVCDFFTWIWNQVLPLRKVGALRCALLLWFPCYLCLWRLRLLI